MGILFSRGGLFVIKKTCTRPLSGLAQEDNGYTYLTVASGW